MAQNKLLVKITSMLNKHGEIKGKDKKETKALKGSCPHWKINKKGKKVTNIKIIGDYGICKACGAKIPLHLYSNDEVKKTVNGFRDLNNQAKFLSIATNSGDEMVGLFSKQGVLLNLYKKNYKKIRKIAEKQDSLKKGKKKNKNKGNGGASSDAFGSWGSV